MRRFDTPGLKRRLALAALLAACGATALAEGIKSAAATRPATQHSPAVTTRLSSTSLDRELVERSSPKSVRERVTAAATQAHWPDAPKDARITPEGWFTPPPKVARPPLSKHPRSVFIIPIREAISTKTFDVLRRKAVRARSGDLVILDMDTWGGEAGAALDISRLLKTDMKNVYTVCFVRTRAISAGALIAMACDEIVMTEVGTFGDCAPIAMGGKLEGVEREKMETVIRNEFAESAEKNGYNVALAESMVSIHREVWLVRDVKTGELRYVLGKDFRGQVRVPPGVTSAPSNPEAAWELLRVVVPGRELLTVHPRQAVEYGFATSIVESDRDKPYAALLRHFGAEGEPVVLSDTTLEKVVGFMTSPIVTSILIMAGLFFLYIEMHTPGLGLAGTLAISCFAVLFGSRYLLGLANYLEIALFVLGMALIAVEILAIPGFGLVGIAGILCCVVALVAIMVGNLPSEFPIPRTDLDWSFFTNGLLALSAGSVGAVIAGAMVSKYLPQFPVIRGVVLPPAQAAGDAPVPDDSPHVRIKPGDTGMVEFVCRPVGKVRFGEYLLDAQSEGDIIPDGQRVRVIRREGNMIVVEKA